MSKSRYQIAADIWNNTAPENRPQRFGIKESDVCPALIEANFEDLDMFAVNEIVETLGNKGYFA
jgi:hypothetical protein